MLEAIVVWLFSGSFGGVNSALEDLDFLEKQVEIVFLLLPSIFFIDGE